MASETTVHTPKPDPMASRAPAQVTRPVEERPSSGIEVGATMYAPNMQGQVLDHRMYVVDDPEKEYRFITDNDKFGAARSRAKGFRPEKDAETKATIRVGGMTLASRPRRYADIHAEDIKVRTLTQARKYSKANMAKQAADSLGIDPGTVIGSESTQHVEVMVPSNRK